jgi:sulfur carrier protein
MCIEKKIFINGHEFFIKKDLTINDILEYFNYKNSLFVVEYNNLICDRNEWSQIKINSNDKIEIISIVGGG